MNRPKGVITFVSPLNAESSLNAWSGDVNSLLAVIEKTNHLIEKEEVLHSIAVAAL